MQHIIRKQIIELRLGNRQDAFRIQNRMSERYRHDLLPVMETLFDEAAAEDETLYIDTLEIDLGVLSEKDFVRQTWDDELLAPLINQLRSTLAKYSDGVENTAGHQPVTLGIGGQWLFYMKRGYLPWNTLQTDATWKKKVLEVLSTDYNVVTELRNLIRSDADAPTRITEQHTESFLVQLIEILTARKQQYLSGLLDELEILYRALPDAGLKMPFGQKIEIRKKIWEIILKVSAAGEATGEEAIFVQQILKSCFGRLIRPRDLSKDITSQLSQLLPIIRELEEKLSTLDMGLSSGIAEELDLQQNGQAKQAEEKPDPDEEGIFIQQAGAVLLHPFLGTFFSRLELTAAGSFRDLEAQQKALYLVHYLCTGSAKAEEHELVIPKVLCGYPLKKPVRKQVRLSHKEKDEAEHLLEELIQQWDKLKNTSTAGLREGFLQRSGKLVAQNDLWCIQVETDTIDLLLDHLPWNLSIIKLPWMKELIRVEWR